MKTITILLSILTLASCTRYGTYELRENKFKVKETEVVTRCAITPAHTGPHTADMSRTVRVTTKDAKSDKLLDDKTFKRIKTPSYDITLHQDGAGNIICRITDEATKQVLIEYHYPPKEE